MKVIYKYSLLVKDTQELSLPIGAKILTVQLQFGTPFLWAIVDPDETLMEKRTIQIIGTGHFKQDNEIGKYISTFQLYDGEMIFHVFEKKIK